MTDLRQAAQRALKALQDLGMKHYENTGEVLYKDVYQALKAALAEQPASKPWVGLTEEERTDICDDYGANIHWRAFRAIEDKLQEKNA